MICGHLLFVPPMLWQYRYNNSKLPLSANSKLLGVLLLLMGCIYFRPF